MRASNEDRERFTDVLQANRIGKTTYHTVRENARLIMHNGARYRTIQDAWCSIEMTDEEVTGTERREAAIERRITKLVAEINPAIEIMFSGNPRGYTVKLVLPNGEHDDWTGYYYCVPTA